MKSAFAPHYGRQDHRLPDLKRHPGGGESPTAGRSQAGRLRSPLVFGKKISGNPARASATIAAMNLPHPTVPDVNRRDFIRGGSTATLMTMLGGVELKAAEAPKAPEAKASGPKVKCGLIGLGAWGREILGTLQRKPEAQITALCDTYGLMLRRAAGNAPGATAVDDYRKMLADKSVQAVFVATPTHLHREIVLEALQAGKHVYCEAPLANTIEDTKAIAKAARGAVGQVFQAGLALRADPQRHFLLQFIRTGAIGRNVMARAQWHKKQSWRGTSANPDREKDVNWRLAKDLSLGLAGEIGIHHLDSMAWIIKDLPKAVTGFGGVLHWTDGRQIPDTIQAVLEFPNGIQGMYDATLANSFDGDYEVFLGSDAAIMLRASKAWLFKEVDSPLLGWEVYARKDVFYKETGIALVANASKSSGTNEGAEDAPFTNTPLSFSVEAFLTNVNEVAGAVEDFTATFDAADKRALAKHLEGLKLQHAATWKEGLEATVVAIKTNEAITGARKIEFQKDWFELA
jgi:predicted dehydrogenase